MTAQPALPLIDCTPARHADAILAILNEAIVNPNALIGAIDSANTGSIALHESLGFRLTGALPQVGFKFGRWLDLAFHQLLLDTPDEPVDG